MGYALGAALALALLLAPTALAEPPAIVNPDEFRDAPVLSGLEVPTAVRFAGGFDDRIFVADKTGVVLAFDGALDDTPTQVLDLRTEVQDFWDRGLLGMALAPGFGSNGGNMYLLYTRDAGIGETPPRWGDDCPSPPGATEDGCVVSGALVKVPIGPFGVATGPPVPIIENEWCAQFPSHTVGTVAFGPDGMLYVGAGEGANFNAPDWGQYGGNPCQDPFPGDDAKAEGGALRSQDVRTNGDPAGLDGAIVRIDPVTGAAAPGNPFTASPDANKRRVIAYGMRNPFRFTFRPGTRELWLGDVGWGTWEEINKIDTIDTGPQDAENLGWPCFEGDDRVSSYNAFLELCTSLGDSDYTPPQFVYRHDEDVAPGDGCGAGAAGSSISGVAFQNDVLFFADYARNCIWSIHLDGNGDLIPGTAEVIARGTPGAGPVDLQIGPGGDLYYVYLDFGVGEVRRIRPAGPTAAVTATPASGPVPLTVSFNASGSTGQPLQYSWDLDNDGQFDDGQEDGDGNAATTRFDYTEGPRRNVTAKVKVTNTTGSDVAAVTVSVGNTPPHGTHIDPVGPVQNWAIGDQLHFAGGTLDDGDTPTLTWLLTVKHCELTTGLCHKHPVQTHTGPTATFTAPDHEYPSHLEVQLTAFDGLLKDTTTLDLNPRTVQLKARSDPPSLAVGVNAEPPAPSITETLIAGSTATLTAPSPQSTGGQDYVFQSWSDGDAHRSRTLAVHQDTDLVALFLSQPASATLPAVTGEAREGATLTGTVGTWRGNALTYTREWLRCDEAGGACAVIPGAAAATYRLVAADRGHRVIERVTARNGLGAATAQSAPTALVAGVLSSDTSRPRLRLSAAAHRRLAGGRLRLRVDCPGEACRVRVRALLRIAGTRARATKAVTKHLRRGRAVTVSITLPRALRAAAANALRAGKHVTVRWEATATDTAGNRTTQRRSVSLRR